MSDQTSKNKALMRRIYEEMWNQAAPSLAVEIFELPEGVERFVSKFLVSFPDLKHTVDEMIAEDDRVEVHRHDAASSFLPRGTRAAGR